MKDEMSIMPAKENEIENEKAGSVISLRASAILLRGGSGSGFEHGSGGDG